MTRLPWGCPSPRILSREFSRGDKGARARRIREHVHSCASCRSDWASLERLRDLTRALPDAPAGSEDLEAVRTALLVNSQSTRARFVPIPIWLSIAAGAAVLAFYLLFHRTERARDHATGPKFDAPLFPTSKIRRGTVHASAATQFTLAGDQPDEVVKLRQGEITVEVEPLSAKERFRVETGDAEIEVKGTAFSALARDDRLMRVDVSRGLVVVRVRAKAPVTLGPNERWEVPSVANDAGARLPRRSLERPVAVRPYTRSSNMLRTERSGSAAAAPGLSLSPAESAFAEGWQDLRAQDLADATAAFARAVTLAGDQPLAEDAWFWMAVSQARIPRPAEARVSLTAFIDRFPRSPRIGQAAAMLGWILIDQGDLNGAAQRFANALRDPGAEVRQSATEGLRAVDRRRGHR
jgi:TolA-binding protein